MKIVLVGYMGSGKSTVGKLLAAEMGYKFLDLDQVLETKLGSTIPDIFKNKGEVFFRKKEHEYLKEVLLEDADLILSTGGGAPCYSGNMESMLQLADMVIYLKVSIPGLVKRLEPEKAHRPLIRDIAQDDLPEFIGKHLFERNTFYLQADQIVNADDRDPETIVRDIQALLR